MVDDAAAAVARPSGGAAADPAKAGTADIAGHQQSPALNSLRLISVVLPILFLASVQVCAMLLLEPALGAVAGHWVAFGVIAAGVVLFSSTVFRYLSTMHGRIVRQNEELGALNAVARAVSGTLDLEDAILSAFGSVTAVTRSRAGEVVLEGTGGAAPLRVTIGSDESIAALAALKQRLEGSGDSGPAVRVVTVDSVRRPHGETKYETYARVALEVQGQRLGSLRLLGDEKSYLRSPGSDALLASIAGQIAVAVRAARLFGDVLSRGREAQALYNIALEITSLREINVVLNSIVRHTRDVLGIEAAAICLAQPSGGMFLAAYSGPKEAQPPLWKPLAGISSLLAALPDDVSAQPPGDHCPLRNGDSPVQRLAAPLAVGRTRIGELCVSRPPGQEFTPRQQELLAALADMAAIAINNSRLLERERYVAVLEERANLAREMHDSLAQVLGYLHLKAQAAKRTLLREDIPAAEAELDEISTLAHEAYIDVREAILGLRETVSPGVGITGTLKEYLAKFGRQSGIQTKFQVSAEHPLPLSPEAEVQIIRVVQEALTNVRKHAGAKNVSVEISQQGGHMLISVQDDGRGFDPGFLQREDAHRFGVRTMRERVAKAGGHLEIESEPGRGTTVRISMPLERGTER